MTHFDFYRVTDVEKRTTLDTSDRQNEKNKIAHQTQKIEPNHENICAEEACSWLSKVMV